MKLWADALLNRINPQCHQPCQLDRIDASFELAQVLFLLSQLELLAWQQIVHKTGAQHTLALPQPPGLTLLSLDQPLLEAFSGRPLQGGPCGLRRLQPWPDQLDVAGAANAPSQPKVGAMVLHWQQRITSCADLRTAQLLASWSSLAALLTADSARPERKVLAIWGFSSPVWLNHLLQLEPSLCVHDLWVL